jgi:hypothetical protein
MLAADSSRNLSGQFAEKIVVEWNAFAGTATFDILQKIGHGIAGAVNENIADFMHDFIKTLFLPGAVAWVWLGCQGSMRVPPWHVVLGSFPQVEFQVPAC